MTDDDTLPPDTPRADAALPGHATEAPPEVDELDLLASEALDDPLRLERLAPTRRRQVEARLSRLAPVRQALQAQPDAVDPAVVDEQIRVAVAQRPPIADPVSTDAVSGDAVSGDAVSDEGQDTEPRSLSTSRRRRLVPGLVPSLVAAAILVVALGAVGLLHASTSRSSRTTAAATGATPSHAAAGTLAGPVAGAAAGPTRRSELGQAQDGAALVRLVQRRLAALSGGTSGATATFGPLESGTSQATDQACAARLDRLELAGTTPILDGSAKLAGQAVEVLAYRTGTRLRVLALDPGTCAVVLDRTT